MRTKNIYRHFFPDGPDPENYIGLLDDPDTPSFIRRYFNHSMVQKTAAGSQKTAKAPGVVTTLLNTLFGEDDVEFAY